MKSDHHKSIIILVMFVIAASFYFAFARKEEFAYVTLQEQNLVSPKIIEKKTTHLATPEPVRAIYMTSWVAGTPTWRKDLVDFIVSSEINALVIDMKDYTGRISFETSDLYIQTLGASEKRIPDIKEFIEILHQKNIYVIARISVFQDPYFVSKYPELAVKRRDGTVWTDYKGLPWIDPAAQDFWDYTVKVAREAEKVGFDEVNFDYVRFPSDGNMSDISYDYWDEVTPPAEIMRDFFAYLHSELEEYWVSRPPEQLTDQGLVRYIPTRIPLSVDLFGLTTWFTSDLTVGQVLEYAEPYFDYISPMVYPSHYPAGFNGYQNPANYPYEIIYQAMTMASKRLIAASSTPSKLRPWIQDFDLGAVYDEEMIRKEKQAIYDAGLTSWMAWDAANRYTREAYR